MEEIFILDTTDKETIPPTDKEIIDVETETKDFNKNFDQVEMGYCSLIQVIIDEKINTKELMKIESI
eukprot:10563603-Ditylum_brightwellii.AAC.1